MKNLFNKQLSKTSISPISSLVAKARYLKKNGKTIIDAGVGEFYKRTNEEIIQAGLNGIKKKEFGYTNVRGIDPLREQILYKIKNFYDISSATDENIISTAGAKHALYCIFQALINPDDEVIIFSPYWPSYPEMIKTFGGKVKLFDISNVKSNSIFKFEKLLSSKTKAVIFNSPSNPSGNILPEEIYLSFVLSSLKNSKAFIIHDNVYEYISWSAKNIKFPFLKLGPNAIKRNIIVNSVSKSCCMTGWRVGFIYASHGLIKILTAINSQSISNIPVIAQYAAIHAIKNESEIADQICSELKENVKKISYSLNKVYGINFIIPESGMFCFVDFKKYILRYNFSSDVDFADYLLNEYGLVVIPGSVFGKPDFLRFSFGVSKINLKKIITIINKL